LTAMITLLVLYSILQPINESQKGVKT
jgi:hypothetical protein